MTGPFRDLRSYLSALEARGDLATIEAEVDPDLEAAEIHRRVIDAGGPALLFRRVKGYPWPVVTNLFGTRDRAHLAFGDRAREVVARMATLPERLVPPTLGRLWGERKLLRSLARCGLKPARGPVGEV